VFGKTRSLREHAMKMDILRAANYTFNFDHQLYFNRDAKKAFSFPFLDDHPEDEVLRSINESTDGSAWKFYFNFPPSKKVEQELESTLSEQADTTYAPSADICEDERNIMLKLEVPGIDEKDIDVRIENITLTVHGERKIVKQQQQDKQDKQDKQENDRRVEWQCAEFTRSFTLPGSVDVGQVSANYDKGVLEINLAKKAEATPKQIKVNLGSDKALEAKVLRQARM
jgi:HSP20 family protein